jgi:hypothetical protein
MTIKLQVIRASILLLPLVGKKIRSAVSIFHKIQVAIPSLPPVSQATALVVIFDSRTLKNENRNGISRSMSEKRKGLPKRYQATALQSLRHRHRLYSFANEQSGRARWNVFDLQAAFAPAQVFAAPEIGDLTRALQLD